MSKKKHSRAAAQRVIAHCAKGISLPAISGMTGIARHTVWAMVTGRYYEDMCCEQYVQYQGLEHMGRKLTDEQAHAIRDAYAEGTVIEDLRRQYKVNRRTIEQILRGVTYQTAGGDIVDVL